MDMPLGLRYGIEKRLRREIWVSILRRVMTKRWTVRCGRSTCNGAVLLRDQHMARRTSCASSPVSTSRRGTRGSNTHCPVYPNIYILSNKIVDGKPIGAHNDGVGLAYRLFVQRNPCHGHHAVCREVACRGPRTRCWRFLRRYERASRRKTAERWIRSWCITAIRCSCEPRTRPDGFER